MRHANRSISLPSAESPRPTLSERDLTLLRSLVDSAHGRDRDAAELLEAELQRAEIVPTDRLPATVVQLNARVIFEDANSGDRQEITLVLPHEADLSRRRVSVLAPIGAALLGMAVGDAIEWPLPGGKSRKLRIVAIPEGPPATS